MRTESENTTAMSYTSTMIERYALFDTSLIKERFMTANTILGNFKKRYNVSPTQNMPVIVHRDEERKIEFKSWGFVPQNARHTRCVSL